MYQFSLTICICHRKRKRNRKKLNEMNEKKNYSNKLGQKLSQRKRKKMNKRNAYVDLDEKNV